MYSYSINNTFKTVLLAMAATIHRFDSFLIYTRLYRLSTQVTIINFSNELIMIYELFLIPSITLTYE